MRALSQELLADMVDMETGARGYLLVGDDQYLDPWKRGNQRFDQHWKELKELRSDNPALQKRLDEMKAHREAFVGVIQPLLDQRKGMGMGSIEMTVLFAEFAQDRDKLAMDDFRRVEPDLAGAESALLVERSAAAETTRARPASWRPRPTTPQPAPRSTPPARAAAQVLAQTRAATSKTSPASKPAAKPAAAPAARPAPATADGHWETFQIVGDPGRRAQAAR